MTPEETLVQLRNDAATVLDAAYLLQQLTELPELTPMSRAALANIVAQLTVMSERIIAVERRTLTRLSAASRKGKE